VSGFIVIYRWNVPEEQEQAFQRQWRELTLHLRSHGGLGSCLTRNNAGEFVAIALWPSEQARSEAFASLPRSVSIPGVERLEESRLIVEEDLWLNSPFKE
jgi:heme-degrading monooxygenase HmoA